MSEEIQTSTDNTTPEPAHACARRVVRERLGESVLAALHAQNKALDAAAILVGLATFVSLNVFLAHASISVWWFVAFLAQGCVIVVLAYLNHDIQVHRKVFPGLVGRALTIILTLPVQLKPTAYEQGHIKHHAHLGTDLDTEAYKKDIDTRIKRILFTTFIGAQLCIHGRFSKTGGRAYPGVFRGASAKIRRQARQDTWIFRIFLAVLVAFALISPDHVILGYLLPFLVVTPVINTIRIVLEHFDYDLDDPFKLATLYPTGPISRLLFVWDAGDCHVVHHLYPRIPFYRMGRAINLMRPIITNDNSIPPPSLLSLLRSWYGEVKPHGSSRVRVNRNSPP